MDSVHRSSHSSMVGRVHRSVVSVHSHNSSRSHSGVVTDHVGGVSNALADLVTLGGDHLLAVLDGGHVHVLGAHCARNTSSKCEVYDEVDDK